MARRTARAESVAPGVPPWMTTFSDLVTLLLTFFVMLMSVASFDDANRVTALLRSLHERMGAAGFDPSLLGPGEASELSTQLTADVTIAPMLAKLAQAFREHMTDAVVEIDAAQDELRVDLPAATFFKRGETTLHPGGYGLLSVVGELLAEEPTVRVEVHGHAGPDEAEAVRDLATERAVNVIARLRERIEGERIVAVAYGATPADPIPGTSPTWERRIGLVFRTDPPDGRAPATRLRTPEESDGR